MIKVLVVDDSAFMRQIFKNTLNQDFNFNVVATARNGEEALKLINELKVDVITLDVEMPVKNGMETLKEIVALPHHVPVIMVSALDSRDTVMKALELGAFDFIPKPSGSISLNIDEIIEQLKTKLKAAATSKNETYNIKAIRPYMEKIKKIEDNKHPIIAIGSSSGGPKALKEIITAFPRDLPAAIVIVQHMPAGFTTSLAKRLHQESAITVKEASEGDFIEPGVALIAPGDFHLEIDDSGKINLNQKPTKWGVRPCVDYMMSSLARTYRERLIGVILTGMGHDGAIGMSEINKNGGYGIVEDKSTALVYGMPSATIKKNAYDEILPLHQIPFKIIKHIERSY